VTEANNLNVEDMAKKMLEMQAALEKVEAEKQVLAKQVRVVNPTADMEASGDDANDASPVSEKIKKLNSIPRPTGSYNIQYVMGLGGPVEARRGRRDIIQFSARLLRSLLRMRD